MEDKTIEQSGIRTIFNAGAALGGARFAAEESNPFVVIPDGFGLKDIEFTLPAPLRKTANVILADSSSFIHYTKKHGSLDECVIYAKIKHELNEFVLTAVINDHGSDKPQWRDHRCILIPELSVEWKRWTGKNKSVMTQNEFAAFLEDNLPDIATIENMPSGSDILKMALEFEANNDKKFRSKTNLQSGGYSIEFVDEENHDTRATMKVFERFTIGIPVFDGSKNAYPVEARLKYRENEGKLSCEKEGKLSFWYEIIRQDRIFKAAIADELLAIKNETGFPILYGIP
jgi:uncharacterized protein YfdQ (DUF2303 family)